MSNQGQRRFEMEKHRVVSRDEWLTARLELLKAEKELTRRSDELARRWQELPWVRIDKEYQFETRGERLAGGPSEGARSSSFTTHVRSPFGRKGASHVLSGPTISMVSRSISIIAM
jgi:hypothetical protein